MSTITLCLFYLTMADRSPSAEYFLTFYSITAILVGLVVITFSKIKLFYVEISPKNFCIKLFE